MYWVVTIIIDYNRSCLNLIHLILFHPGFKPFLHRHFGTCHKIPMFQLVPQFRHSLFYFCNGISIDRMALVIHLYPALILPVGPPPAQSVPHRRIGIFPLKTLPWLTFLSKSRHTLDHHSNTLFESTCKAIPLCTRCHVIINTGQFFKIGTFL